MSKRNMIKRTTIRCACIHSDRNKTFKLMIDESSKLTQK